jgi:HEAT repeats
MRRKYADPFKLMKRSHMALVLSAFGSTLFAIFVWRSSVNNTVYDGKQLVFWLDNYSPGLNFGNAHPDAANRVHQLGTNIIPDLLNMLQKKNGPLQAWLVSHRRLNFFHFKPDELWHDEGLKGFDILGPEASNAVPALIEILTNNSSASSRGSAELALGCIGPNAAAATQPLLKLASRSNDSRVWAVKALGDIHTQPSNVIPVLLKCIDDPTASRGTRRMAVYSLGQYGTAADIAKARLTLLLKDPDRSVRFETTNALKKIDSGALVDHRE